MRTLNLEPGTRNRRSRPGMSIIEVLFSILITTVGLFGAISLFPVASSQAKKARTNDAVAAAGRSAIHTFDIHGMRRFDRWYRYNPSGNLVKAGTISPIDGLQSYCIDSRFVANNSGTNAQVFPYNTGGATDGRVNTTGQFPRMHRIGFFGFGANSNANANKLIADSIFQLEDDLAYSRPGIDEALYLDGTKMKSDRSLPAVQLFDLSATTPIQPIKRQTQGHLSWIATLVPKVDNYAGSGSDEFALSVVVFSDRPTDLTIDGVTERCFPVNVLDGSSGGEVQFTYSATQSQVNEDNANTSLKMRPNNWVLLGCNVQFQPPGAPAPITINRFQWYRVTDCDDGVAFASGRYELYATLVGPDWSWPNMITTSVQATVVENVIAVFEKTIRLDYGTAF